VIKEEESPDIFQLTEDSATEIKKKLPGKQKVKKLTSKLRISSDFVSLIRLLFPDIASEKLFIN
jgi:hypothetical protein